MSKITIGIVDEHTIVQESLCSLLATIEDFDPIAINAEENHIIDELKEKAVNVLIINIHQLNIAILNLITKLNLNYPKVKILVISHSTNEDIILKTIKAGAKGFLDKNANRNEFAEAILSLRSGYDYYSKSITYLLLNKYINKTKKDKILEAGIDNLSSRQVEILKLWGNNFSNKEIAEKLFISVRTVESHKNHIMQKLNFKTTVDMIKFGIKNNLIEI